MDAEEIRDYSDFLRSYIDSGRYTERHVTAALVEIAKAPQGEFEKVWPNVGTVEARIEWYAMKERIANDRAAQGLPSREEEERQADERRKRLMAETAETERRRREEIAAERAERVNTDELVGALAAGKGMPITPKKPTSPPPSTPAQGGTLRDMTAEALQRLFVMMEQLNAMEPEHQSIAMRALNSVKKPEDLSSLRRAVTVYLNTKTQTEESYEGRPN